MQKVAIAGASGFVGAPLVEHLLAEGVYQPVPLVHNSGNAWRVARFGTELRTVDVIDSASLEAALRGCTHVVNCTRGNKQIMRQGMKNLLQASHKLKVERFIHLSSTAVYGSPPHPDSWTEQAPASPLPGSYGWTKLQQDRLVQSFVSKGLPAIILCPPNITGPYSYFLLSVLQAMRHGSLAVLNEPAPCVLVDVSNLAAAITRALSEGTPDGTRMFVTDDDPVDWRDVVEGLSPLLGEPKKVPDISRAELELLVDETRRKSPLSVIGAVKHLASGEVREALRKDPLWEKCHQILRGAVLKTGMQELVRRAMETRTQTANSTGLDSQLIGMQLHSTVHKPELAKASIGYQPVYRFAESLQAFNRWYVSTHGIDTFARDLFTID